MAIYLTEADVAGLIDMSVALGAVGAAHIALARGEATDFHGSRCAPAPPCSMCCRLHGPRAG